VGLHPAADRSCAARSLAQRDIRPDAPATSVTGCDGQALADTDRFGAARHGYVAGMRQRIGGGPLGRRMGRVAEAVGRGLAAGLAGTALMTVSSTREMKLRGREPSTAPAKAVGRLLGVRPSGPKGEQRFATVAHSVTGVSLGAARGLLDVAGVRRPIAVLPAAFAIVMTPEVVLAPALGATDPPWRWGVAETAMSALHHAVWAVGTEVAYRAVAP
jgi:hypothetical protein